MPGLSPTALALLGVTCYIHKDLLSLKPHNRECHVIISERHFRGEENYMLKYYQSKRCVNSYDIETDTKE